MSASISGSAAAGVSRPVWVYFAALIVGGAFWGATWAVGKMLWQAFPPGGLGFWRWFIAFLVLLPFGLPAVIRQRREVMQELPRLAFLGLLGITAFNYLIFRGLHTTTAVNGALLNGATPIYVLLLGFVGVGDRSGWRHILAICIAMPGFILVVTHGDPVRLFGLELVVGDLLVALGMLGWAIYTIYVRRKPSCLKPIPFLFMLAFFGSLFLLPIWLYEASQGAEIVLTWESALAMVFLGVCASVGSYVCWNFGLGGIGPARASLFQYLIPLFAAVFAVFLVGESIHWYHVAGAALMFGGIYASNATRLFRGRRVPAP